MKTPDLFSEDDSRHLIRLARKRKDLDDQMEAALRRGDETEALRIARTILNIDEERRVSATLRIRMV